MDDILDIFIDYTYKNKVFDISAINKIFNILLVNHNFDGKITYVITKKKNIDNTLGEFDFNSTIYICYYEMLKRLRQKAYLSKFEKNDSLSNIEITGRKNAFILHTILHEIEHIKQIESVKDIRNKSLETKLYQYEINHMRPHDDILDIGIIKFYLKILRCNIVYKRDYHLSFMERMANINALEEIKNLLAKLGSELNNIYDAQSDMLNEYIVAEYKKNLIGPTTRFIYNLGYSRDFTQEDLLNINENFNFDNRLRYGFKITEEEYNKMLKC